MTTVWLAAAEPSGDALGAALASALRLRRPDLRLRGVAGPRMIAAGVEPVERSEALAALGLVEVIASVPAIAARVGRLRRRLARDRPAALVTIDAPGVMLPLARAARAAGVPAIHWVSPQIWAWRPGRVDRIAASVDAVLCLLPFEPALYQGRVRAVFTGHPAAAIVPAPVPVAGRPVVALCPGSRDREVRALWPVMKEVARRLRERYPDAAFVVPRAPEIQPGALGGLDATLVPDLAAVAGADAALVASGTATLQLAALRVPMVVVYRVAPATAAIARRVLRTRWVALPNVLAGARIVPEHLQDLDPERLTADLIAVLGRRDQVPRALVDGLAGPDAVRRAAEEVLGWLPAPGPDPARRG